MTEHYDPYHQLFAHGDRMSDAHLGLLVGDLGLGAGITSNPERYREALMLVANAVRRLRAPKRRGRP